MESLRWKPQKKETILSTKIFTVNELKSIGPEDVEGTFFSIETHDWVVVVPIIQKDDQKIALIVRQWRHGTNCLSREFPGGVINAGEDHKDAAQRELIEETGYAAKKLIFGGSISPNPAIMENMCHIYFAEDCYKIGDQKLDEDEFVAVEQVPLSVLYEKMGTDDYAHALMSAALFLYSKYSGNLTI